MKSYFAIVFIIFVVNSSLRAGTISFENPCPNGDDYLVSDIIPKMQTVGDITVSVLDKSKLKYVGSDLGLNSLWNSPIGMEALDIVSREEMYSYGWCYSINGVIPEKLPHTVAFNKGDRVVWWFGYAHYLRGEWLSQCEHSDTRPITSFCSNSL